MLKQAKRFYNFGPFCLDSVEFILYRGNDVVRLAPKAVDTLLILVQNADRVLGKDELLVRIWGAEGGSEEHLFHNISLLRKRLADGGPGEYIQTVHGKGYKFVPAVSLTDGRPPAPSVAVVPAPERRRPAHAALHRWALALLAGCIFVGVTVVTDRLRHPPQPRVLETRQLTRDGSYKTGPLVTEGPLIYFSECGKGGGTECNAVSVPESGGERMAVPSLSGFSISDVSPDGLQFLATKRVAPEEAPQLWTVPVRGGAARSLGGLRGEEPSWSPDATQIVYWNKKSLFVARSDGSDPHALAALPGIPRQPRWSPDGKVLRVHLSNPPNDGLALWEVWADGTHAHALLPGRGNPPRECCGRWTADGRYFLFEHDGDGRSELWARQEKCGPFFWECGKLFPLAQAATSHQQPLPSRDGKSVFAIGGMLQTELTRYDRATRSFVPYLPLDGTPATQVDFSWDARWIAYVKLPDRSLWRSKVDGSDKLQLTYPPDAAGQPHWSPDGKQIAFMENTGGHFKICLIPADGGHAQELIPGDAQEGVPTWSMDGKQIAYGEPLQADKPSSSMSIHLLKLETHKLLTLQGSSGRWTARWSPDGRYIAALELGKDEGNLYVSQSLWLFDLVTQTWTKLAAIKHINVPTWSRDSRYIYFDTTGAELALYRVRIAGRNLERLASLKGIDRGADNWAGVAPDGSPLIVRDTLIQEVYALDVEWP